MKDLLKSDTEYQLLEEAVKLLIDCDLMGVSDETFKECLSAYDDPFILDRIIRRIGVIDPLPMEFVQWGSFQVPSKDPHLIREQLIQLAFESWTLQRMRTCGPRLSPHVYATIRDLFFSRLFRLIEVNETYCQFEFQSIWEGIVCI